MSYRFMRVFVFFDLPTQTYDDKREYLKFRKHLIRSGFLMMQWSVYCKLALNQTVCNSIINNVKKNSPQRGTVQLLVITEKQFEKSEYIVGESNSEVVSSDERLIVL